MKTTHRRLCGLVLLGGFLCVLCESEQNEGTLANECNPANEGICLHLDGAGDVGFPLNQATLALRYDSDHEIAEWKNPGNATYYKVNSIDIKASADYALTFTFSALVDAYKFAGAVVTNSTGNPKGATIKRLQDPQWEYWVPSQKGSLTWYLDPGPPALQLTVTVKRF